ncbi:serine hydrolase domain-containing protein [Marinifilum caeruleilacunae]|uniref:Class C beta-lactamase-related serine hydrolase n=1 Tax=Marinifilum caeruleilacunae TaxID=2499076 RepID=A0ABX1WX14_9BACT|nr:serine hydrolase [Marinifilum caeruleilacunae]NOU60466.1 class C beta-lactamase-related serine hydrolase [Marinifilum caeruleilacunae]
MSRISKTVLILALLTALWMLLAPNYLRTSLIYWYANIDDYKIFENTEVNVADGREWKEADSYNKYELESVDRTYLEDHETVAYLIIQDGKVLYEEYWDGYNADSHSNIFSATKSIVSLLIGIAIDEGKIKSVDEPIGNYLEEFANDERGKLSIKNLLTMSSGLDWDEAYSSPTSITTKAYYGKKLRMVSTDQQLIEEPGIRFRYQSGNTQLLAFIVEEATGETISKYAERTLWKPMHAVNTALWSLDKKDGDEKSFCCFNTNARDAARFGQLVLNHGAWNGKQLISEQYLKDATSPAAYILNEEKTAPLDHYGYQYWVLPYKDMNIPYMRGHRGQYIYSIAEKNAVVVRFGKMKDEIKEGQITMDIPKYVDIALKILE